MIRSKDRSTVRWASGLLVLRMLGALTAAGAQTGTDSLSIARGDRIRIRTSFTANWSPARRVEEVTADSLRWAGDKGDTVWIPRWSVFSIEAHRGEELQRTVIVTTMGIGLVAGTVASMVICRNDREVCAAEDQISQVAEDLSGEYVEPALVLGVAGGLAGALLGWAIATPPRWELAVWPRFDADARPQRGRALAFAFRYFF